MTLAKGAARKLTQRVLSFARVEDVVVGVTAGRTGNTRFANNGVTTTGDVDSTEVSVTVTVDGRTVSVSGNRVDDRSLERLVRVAEERAALAPVDPEHMPPLGPQKYLAVAGRDSATARMGARERAEAVRGAIDAGQARDLVTSGLVQHADRASAIADNKGLFCWHGATSISLSTTCRTRDGTGSGRAAFESHRVGALDAAALARTAADKAEMSTGPRPLDPGRYVAILEPAAVADLLSFLIHALDARAADEGRSYFSAPSGNRIGEKLFSDKITLQSDPTDPEHPAAPFSEGGLPQRKSTWVERGVLRALSYSRFWAQKQGKEPVPRPTSLRMNGTDASLADLIKGVDRGILVTRFWYNRMLEPRTILATGLTRDGTFLVEQGKITTALKNFRYNESPVTMLKNVLALGTPERAANEGGTVVVVPPLVIEGFHFASLSDAV